MPEHKRIFIVVKTYPTISKEYAELVCTAGVLEDGSWIRLYPVPFRRLDFDQKYPKYSWIDIDVVRNLSDFRPETYRPDLSTIRVEEKPKKVDWNERRKILFKSQKIYTDLHELIDVARKQGTSLATFKPTEVLEFVVKPVAREWDPDKRAILENLSHQLNLLQSPQEIEDEFKLVPKVPYEFSYKFVDSCGRQSTLMIEDWEVSMLYFNCLKAADNDEHVAVAKVREKFFDEFRTKDLHFFLGTTKRYHNVAPNPFIIIGTFYPPMITPEQQLGFQI